MSLVKSKSCLTTKKKRYLNRANKHNYALFFKLFEVLQRNNEKERVAGHYFILNYGGKI